MESVEVPGSEVVRGPSGRRRRKKVLVGLTQIKVTGGRKLGEGLLFRYFVIFPREERLKVGDCVKVSEETFKVHKRYLTLESRG
jgi:hypothetical protein